MNVILPIVVRVDNAGAVYLSQNVVSGPTMKHVNIRYAGAIYFVQNVISSTKIKHVDIRYHFVEEYYKAGVIKIIFLKT